MKNEPFKCNLLTISAVGMLTLSLGASLPATAGSVVYADAVPAGPTYPDCAINDAPTGHDGGISYEWTVKMGKKDKVSFVNHVGAKSYNEPPPFYEPPYTGWTHTSNWVALTLTDKTKLRIEVARQEGVPFTSGTSIVTARNMLVPALSVYSGHDNTSCEDHRYNTAGNVDWSTVVFIGNQHNKKGAPVAVYETSKKLNPGPYSIAIGGSPAVIDPYPAGDCNPIDPVCYAYTGRQGYRVVMTTGGDD